jgi:hypothetical protein
MRQSMANGLYYIFSLRTTFAWYNFAVFANFGNYCITTENAHHHLLSSKTKGQQDQFAISKA